MYAVFYDVHNLLNLVYCLVRAQPHVGHNTNMHSGTKWEAGPGVPGGAVKVGADAGRGAGMGARRCTVQRGSQRNGKVLARTPCLSPSVNPPERMIAIEQTVGRALGGVIVATKGDMHSVEE